MLYTVTPYPPDMVDGVPRPPTVVSADAELHGIHEGTVYVQPGATLDLKGDIRGTLVVEPGAAVEIIGRQQGTLHVYRGGKALVTGAIQGTMHNDGTIIVEKTGTAAGTLHNDGRFVLRGRQGGARTGSGSFEIEPGGEVVQPVHRNGADVYEWKY